MFWSRRHFLLGAATASILASITPTPSVAQRQTVRQVFLLRGFADVFSAGLDQMGEQLRASGVDARVRGHGAWSSVARRIIQDRERGLGGPVILIGHSLGANGIIKVAEMLQEKDISVDLLITLAATSPDPVPSNVRRAVNYYFRTHGWGEPLVAGPGFHGSLSNKDYSGVAEVGHFNIDKQRSVQDEITNLALAAARS